MARALSLAYLTAAPLSPPDAVRLAAEIGYRHVGLRIAPAAPGGDFSPVLSDAALLRETIRSCADTGVSIFDIEIVRIGAGFSITELGGFFDVSAALSARAVLVAGDDGDEMRLIDNFAAFCAAAAPYGLTGDLEFMPWTAVRDCKSARNIVERSGAPNGRVLVDALHVARSTTTLADIAALPRGLLGYAQICDAPVKKSYTAQELVHTAREARLLPGDGGIDLRGIFSALPDDLPISVEIPNTSEKNRLGIDEWVSNAFSCASRYE